MTRAPSRRVASKPRPGRGAASPAPARHAATQGLVGAQDPAQMAPDARLAVLGAILATGYRRFRVSREKGLAESAEPEAPCDQAVDGDGAEPAEEVA